MEHRRLAHHFWLLPVIAAGFALIHGGATYLLIHAFGLYILVGGLESVHVISTDWDILLNVLLLLALAVSGAFSLWAWARKEVHL